MVMLKIYFFHVIILAEPYYLYSLEFHGDVMIYETEFTQASILLIILTAIALFTADNLFPVLLIGGFFMVFITFRSLSEKMIWRTLILQFLLSIAYILVSGNMVAYLIFFEFRVNFSLRRLRFLRLILPSAAYLAAFLFDIQFPDAGSIYPASENGLPRALFGTFILFVSTLLLALVEYLVVSYIFVKREAEQMVSITALAELYEKKLNQELVMKNYLADKTARLEERENISRNIHNSVGHSVTAAIVALDAAELLLTADPEKAREKIRAANRRIHTGLESIRQAVRILDTEESFLSAQDFIDALRELAENFRMDTALQIHINAADIMPLSLPREYGEFFCGAVSELLANGVRHGNANRFVIHVVADSAHIRLSVTDNGVSDFSPQNSRERIENGYGLKKISSFVKKCGGSAVFENNGGFYCMITLPLYKEKDVGDN